MIDQERERLISLKEVIQQLPSSIKPPCYDTILLWAKRGVRGVVLETTWVGGRKYTSIEALARFMADITARRSASPLPTGIDAENTKRAVKRAMSMIGRS